MNGVIVPAILRQKYDSFLHLVEYVSQNVEPTLQNYCKQRNGYAFMSRIKRIDSLAEKIETGRFQKWSDINDLFACTIIIPILSQEQEVSDFCHSIYVVQEVKGPTITKKDPEIFRFDSTRIYAQLRKPDGLEVSEYPNIYDVIFEIQIKTAFEHAWSVATHDLVYKGPTVDWKRQRLAAQIKATVEQLDTLILSFEQTLEYILESPWSDTEDKKRIFERIRSWRDKGYIPSECMPHDLSRFCNSLLFLLQSSKKSKEIDNALNVIESNIHQTSNDLFPRSISLLQYCLAILVSQKFINPPTSKYCSHISDELIILCPELRNTNFKFDYEITH